MAKINEIDITSLLFQEGSAPSTPASTKWRAYFKTDGLYVKDDAGTETGPLSTGGGGGGMTPLDTWDHSVDGNTSPIIFSSISGSYGELLLVGNLKGDDSGATSNPTMRVGTGGTIDSGSNYWSYQEIKGASGDAEVTAGTAWALDRFAVGTSGVIGSTSFVISLPFYALTDIPRTATGHSYLSDAGYGSHLTAYWENTSGAIDIIHLIVDSDGSNFTSGKVRLYGR